MTTIKERPIIMADSMAQACYAGRKTMTRRVVRPQPGEMVKDCYARPDGLFIWLHLPKGAGVGMGPPFHCPYGSPGDRLWVKEAFAGGDFLMVYRAEDPDLGVTWMPAASMPRIACRAVLEITSVRVERLQDISEEDAKAEGIQALPLQDTKDPSAWWQSAPGEHQARSAKQSFALLWDSRAKPGEKWKDNPWTWVIGFRRVEEEED